MEFRSNTELFDAVNSLKSELAASGMTDASSCLEKGMSGLNGLTDGWAYLLEHLESVNGEHGSELSSDQREKLNQITGTVHKVVYRV
ncbi:MAG: hypothetical protein COB09_15460 [Thalassobium sp.]|jgi:hypothetical protein|nr:MAG: hypothetical protein COB09_15460 [Thalassobium sp.]